MREKFIDYFFDSKEQYEAHKPYISFIKIGIIGVIFVQLLMLIKWKKKQCIVSLQSIISNCRENVNYLEGCLVG